MKILFNLPTKKLNQAGQRSVAVKRITLALVGLSLVSGAVFVTGFGQNNYRLGGAFVGGNSMYTWSVLFAPGDAAGQTAAARPILRNFNNQFAGLLAAFGADNLSDATGEAKMVRPDTASWTLVSQMQVTPKQLGDELQNKAIIVSHGTWKFTSQDTAVLDYVLDIYLPSADADGDGYPDAGVQPVLSVPTQDNAKRVPILCRCKSLSVNWLSSIRLHPSGVRRSDGERSEPSAAEPRRGECAPRTKNWSRAGHVGFLLGCRKHIQHENITWPTTPILNS